MSLDAALKTPLYEAHKALKAKMVPFGGWLMPVSYAGVLAEHKAVRERCGVFDVSHMGEVFVTGPEATRFLQSITINDIDRLSDGTGQYTAILHPTGGMIDDLIIYRLKASEYLICVNASNTAKDYSWIKKQSEKTGGVSVINESENFSQLAVQGPNSQAVVGTLVGAAEKAKFGALPYMGIMEVNLFGMKSYMARTGYTGEHGYELYVPNEVAANLWTAILEQKDRHGVEPVGLGARDTLRLEACYLLYGNDMNDDVSPLEAGIAWACRLDKGNFLGKDALIKQKEAGLTRQQFAFKMEDDGIPRHDMLVFKGGEEVGKVTSGSVLPTVGGAGGMALLNPRKVALGDQVEVDVRGKRKLARLVQKPLYKAKVKG